MEHEAPTQEGVPANKQAFIYKKNQQSAAKAITRKLRPSHVPQSQDAEVPSTNNNYQNPFKSATRSSQHEAETIATQGLASSPSKAASSGKFARVDSDMMAATDGNGKMLDNRRFHKG